MRIVLFSLTGFGNHVLPALLAEKDVTVPAVFTHKYDAPFPYYEEKPLIDQCEELGVTSHHGFSVSSEQGIGLLRSYEPDLILVAAFRQIIRLPVQRIPKLGIVNLHPSLLPKYRGVCPTNHIVLGGDQKTGMTAHYLVDEIDAGNILLQRTTDVSPRETDASLRYRSAVFAGEMVSDLLKLFRVGAPVGMSQDVSKATFAPRPLPEEGYLENDRDFALIDRKIRAFNPFPGTSILVDGERISVIWSEPISSSESADGVRVSAETVDVWRGREGIRLFRKGFGEALVPSPRPRK